MKKIWPSAISTIAFYGICVANSAREKIQMCYGAKNGLRAFTVYAPSDQL